MVLNGMVSPMREEECPPYVDQIELSVSYFRAYVNPVLTLVGVFGNIVALYLFSTHRPWNRFAIYAMSLAISDSLVLISNTFLDDFLGRGLYFLTDKKWMMKLDTYSIEACRTMEVLGSWFVFTSGSLLVAFSLDRVACLWRPLRCRSNSGISVAVAVCAGITVLGLLISIPQAIMLHLVRRPIRQTREQETREPNATSWDGNETLSDSPIEIVATYTTCTLNTEDSSILPFLFSTIITYMLPCVCMLMTNGLLAQQLHRLKNRRLVLCNSKHTKRQLKEWKKSIREGQTSVEDRNDSVTLTNETMTSLMQRRRTQDIEGRRETMRVVVLVIMSALYLCFTCPVCIALSLRASLSSQAPRCQRLLYAHLSRLLSTVKDFNYAMNGYIYACFFRFYRTRLRRFLTCTQMRSRKGPRNASIRSTINVDVMSQQDKTFIIE